jgi:hypothetical protein
MRSLALDLTGVPSDTGAKWRDFRIFGFFPSKRADVEDSEIIERRGDLQVTGRMTTEHIAELKTLLESEAAAQQIVPD